ncbi:rRNA maturation RNase YbeY [Emticicia sp. SJ17W-69]|uniref:rRNA maturation RNase YbeY n=1 Tax=Emticicia sp. SJ17W-69 TaxID=3421657 RepID=UPI003EBE3D85
MINFHTEDINFKVEKPIKTKKWLKKVIEMEGFELSEINYIFCSDEYLHKINLEYLDHDTLTDIITFDNSEEKNLIEGDIFVSIDRVNDNAKDFNSSFEQELQRVLVHGVLHLCGYYDKSIEDEKQMRAKEDFYLNIW